MSEYINYRVFIDKKTKSRYIPVEEHEYFIKTLQDKIEKQKILIEEFETVVFKQKEELVLLRPLGIVWQK